MTDTHYYIPEAIKLTITGAFLSVVGFQAEFRHGAASVCATSFSDQLL